MIFNQATAEQIKEVLDKMGELASQEDVDTLMANMLKAETLTASENFSITADDQKDFFTQLGQFLTDKVTENYQTLHATGVWQSHYFVTVFCTRIPSNVLQILYTDNGGNIWTVKYSIDTQTVGAYFKYVNTVLIGELSNRITALETKVAALGAALPYSITIDDTNSTIDFTDR